MLKFKGKTTYDVPTDKKSIINNYLGIEVLALLSWIVLGVGCDVATTDFFDGDVLNIETNVVTGKSLRKRLVVHLHGFDLFSEIDVQIKTRGTVHTRKGKKKTN